MRACRQIAGGIYDFSGTQDAHGYHENQGPANGMKAAVTKAEVCSAVFLLDATIYEKTSDVLFHQIADWTRLWWDGQSDAWTTEAAFVFSLKNNPPVDNPFKLVIGGVEYRIMRRAGFGEGDCQHVIFGRSKDKESKTGCVIAHSDYTVCAGVYDEEANQKDGALSLQMQQLMIAYKGSGF